MHDRQYVAARVRDRRESGAEKAKGRLLTGRVPFLFSPPNLSIAAGRRLARVSAQDGSLSVMRFPSAPPCPSALRLVARVGLLYACASDVRPEWASLRASELSALLRARGVDTSGVFERAELLRLLATPQPGPASEAAEEQPLPRVNDMPAGDVMDELDRRGVTFDVLAPPQKLSRLLVQARRRAPLEARPPPAPQWPPPAPQWPPPPPPPPPPSPSPSPSPSPRWQRPATAEPATDGGATPAAAAAAPPRQPQPQAQPQAQPQPPVPLQPPPQPGAPPVAEPVEPSEPVEPPELLPLLRGAVAGAGALLSTALGEADRRAGGPSATWGPALQSVNASLPRGSGDAISRNVADVISSITRRLALGRRGKAALLALCVCALRFGLVRTLLVATSLKLSQAGRPSEYSHGRYISLQLHVLLTPPRTSTHLHPAPPPRLCRSWWAVPCATYYRGEGRAATPRSRVLRGRGRRPRRKGASCLFPS